MNKLNNTCIVAAISLLAAACQQTKHQGAGPYADSARTSDTLKAAEEHTAKPFSKTVNFRSFSFIVESPNASDSNSVTITPSGLSIDNRQMTLPVQGYVYEAEADDITADNLPELAIYSRGQTSDSTAHAIILNNNNGKSLSLAYLPDIFEDKQASAGFNGHDDFRLIENNLVRFFPIYENGKATGKRRQLSYRMFPGEASPALKIVDQVDN